MEARYLRIKNWSRFQHYSKRRPPWIKLYNDLIGNGDEFEHLAEPDQWQLVRIWMVASRSSRFTLDEAQKVVPVVPDDERSIRRSIQTLRKVPLAMFIREGWLIPVAEHELLDDPDLASTGASTPLANAHEIDGFLVTNASTLLESENQRVREPEATDQCLHVSAKIADDLGTDRTHALEKMLKLVKNGDTGTPGVLASLCKQLPASEIDDVRIVYAKGGSLPAGKAVNALKQRIRDYEVAVKTQPTLEAA